MIASGLLLLACGAWSLAIVHRLARVAGTVSWLAVSGAATLLITCWLPFATARMAGLAASRWLAPAAALVLLALELFLARRGQSRTARARAWSRLPALARRSVRGRAGAGWAAAFALLFAAHVAGHYAHDLRDRDGQYWSAGAGWEDQSFHSALATSFALGDNLTRLSYPHVPDWPLGYPFLADFQAGWLHAAGLSLPSAFVVGNSLASLVFLLAASCLLNRWLRSRPRAAVALLLWHLAGGLGLTLLWHERWSGLSWGEALAFRDYANDWGAELHFHNLTTAIVWPMRVVLYGLAIAAALVVLLEAVLRRSSRRVGAFALAGGLAGGLPLVGAHGLIVLACTIPPLAALRQPWHHARGWLAAIAVGAMLAVPQMAWMRHQLTQSEPRFVRWHFGWMTGWHGEHPAWTLGSHWAWNTGLWMTLGASAWFFAGRRFRRETFGWWLILPLGYCVVFQPYVFDNIKLFAATALAGAAGCAWWLARAWEAGRAGKLAAVILAMGMTASGLQSVVSEITHPAVVADADARTFAAAVAAHTPRDALILTGPQLHHPVVILAGRRVVAANPSGLTLHGVPHMGERIEEAARLFRGEPGSKEKLHALGVTWICVGPMERIEYPKLNEAFLDEVSEVTLTRGPWQLRKVKAAGNRS